MPPLVNIYQEIEQMSLTLSPSDLLEQRFENDGDGNPIYIGYALTFDAATDEPVWYIQKVTYEAGGIVRKQIPNNGRSYTYVWDDRATYF